MKQKKRGSPKNTDKEIVFRVICFLFLGLLIIYILFSLQLVLPPGKSLELRDWLSFLGGYLSFSGSLAVSVLVYLQERHLAKLTIKQNQVHIECIVDTIELLAKKSKDYNPIARVPTIFKEDDDYFDRFYFCNYYNGPNTFEDQNSRLLILSTRLLCSHNADVTDIKIPKITISRMQNLHDMTSGIVYSLERGSVRNFISQQVHELFMCCYLYPFSIPNAGDEYQIELKFTYNSHEGTGENSAIVFMKREANRLYIVDGNQNPFLQTDEL